jgi:purine-nucleoside phosphorylase
MTGDATIDDAVTSIRERTPLVPRAAVVLGSGLGGFADRVEGAVTIPYGEIPGWPVSTALGHAGTLVLGTFSGVPVAVMKGRAHLYEGHPAPRVAFGWRGSEQARSSSPTPAEGFARIWSRDSSCSSRTT